MESKSQEFVREQLIHALMVATAGFSRTTSTTLMSWPQSYDMQGRPTSADPNYRSGQVNIAGVDYWYVVKGWQVRVWDTPARYTDLMADKPGLFDIDLTPDYLKATDSE